MLLGIARRFGVSEILIGLTIVSLGTTLPELVVTLSSVQNQSSDIVIGNSIGSCLCNLLLILGIATLLKPIKFEKTTLKLNLPFLILVIFLTLVMSCGIFTNSNLVLTKFSGILLLTLAVIYFGKPIIDYFLDKSKNATQANEVTKESNLLKSILFILLGGIALKIGGDFVVESSINLAHIFNISERVISLTIVAIGTSLPELVTSIVAILKGNEDIAEGNIIGACSIDLTLVLGFRCIII